MNNHKHNDDTFLKRCSIPPNQLNENLSEKNCQFPEPASCTFPKESTVVKDLRNILVYTPLPKMPHFHDKKKTCSTMDPLSVSPPNFFSPPVRNLTDSFEKEKTENEFSKNYEKGESSSENYKKHSENIFRTPKKQKQIDEFENSNYFKNAPRKINDNQLEFSPTAVQFSNLNDL